MSVAEGEGARSALGLGEEKAFGAQAAVDGELQQVIGHVNLDRWRAVHLQHEGH